MPFPAPTEARSACSAAAGGEKSSRGAGTSLGKADARSAGRGDSGGSGGGSEQLNALQLGARGMISGEGCSGGVVWGGQDERARFEVLEGTGCGGGERRRCG